MRFVEFLKSTVLLAAGAATALGVISVLVDAASAEARAVWILALWWLACAAIGLWMGRADHVTPAIGRLLAGAKASPTLPVQEAGRILINRLWPLLALTILAGAAALVIPQVPGIGAGFAIIGTIAWRRQHSAVAAIERRDGVVFYVLRSSPLRPISLLRTPGLKELRPESVNGALS